jgi:hypothetical protein
MYYKFKRNDVLKNSIKTHPKYEIFSWSGSLYINQKQSGVTTPIGGPLVSGSSINLYEYNVVSQSTIIVALGESLKDYDNVTVNYNSEGNTTITPDRGEYPFTASVKRFLYVPSEYEAYSGTLVVGDANYQKLNPMEFSGSSMRRALGSTMAYYKMHGKHYMSNHDQFGNLSKQLDPSDLDYPSTDNLIDIPKIFYGDGIRKGSVRLKYFITGTKIAECHDLFHNGELIQVSGNQAGTVPMSSTVGVVLYDEGIIILSGTTDPKKTFFKLSAHSSNRDLYKQVKYPGTAAGPGGSGSHVTDWPQWQYFFNGVGPDRTFDGVWGRRSRPTTPPGGARGLQAENASYSLEFEGVHDVPVLTMFAHAPKTHLNHSNNPTFLEFSQSLYPTSTDSYAFQQNDKMVIKNTVSSSYYKVSGTFEKQTFISNVAIFDKDRNLIGVAKVATPVRKTEEQDYTFKLKLDL